MEVTEIRGKRRKRLLDDLRRKIYYWKVKEEALYGALMRALWQTYYRMNESRTVKSNKSLPNIVRVVKSGRMRWAGHVARMGQERGVYRVLVGKPEGKRPMGRPRRRWEDNIKMDNQEGEGGCGDWMELAQDRDRWRALMSTVMNLRVPKMRGISWLAAEPVSFSRRTLLHGVSK